MNRKKFIKNVSFGVAGMSLVSSCSGGKNENVTEKTNLLKEHVPDYRTKIKSSFALTNTKRLSLQATGMVSRSHSAMSRCF